MAESARVSSVEGIEAFRSDLIVFLGKARPILEDACDEVIRTRVWLQQDRRLFWENQVRRRAKALEQAEATLFRAELSNLREPNAAERMAVQRTKRALTEAEDKLKQVKQWSREFDNRAEPLVKQLESLRTMLANELPKGVVHLSQILKALDAYMGVKPAAMDATPTSAGDGSSGSAGGEEPAAGSPGQTEGGQS